MNEGTNTIIELRDIFKEYTVNEEKEIVLKSLFYSFQKGYKTSIIGSSGCGKTTVLNIIGGVETNYTGEVLFNGECIVDFDQFRRENISYIFQDLNLVKHLTLIENIKIGLTNNVHNKTSKAMDLLNQVGLKDHAYKYPTQLSGGEKQRVAIARAIARDTDILLCDEPTGSLDKKMKFEIMDLIMEVFRDKTVIFVTHDLEIADKYSDIILGIEDQKLVERRRHQVDMNNRTSIEEKVTNKVFDNRYIKNLLFNKFSLLNSSYLIIVIAAIFMFGIGAIIGVEREVDQYIIDKYKTDSFIIGNPGFTYLGMEDNVNQFNDSHRFDIAGFMVGNTFFLSFDNDETSVRYFMNSMQESISDSFEHDLVAGVFPTKNEEILFSIGSARRALFDSVITEDTTDEDFNVLFDFVYSLTNEELLIEVKKVDISYLNTYRFNAERYYDKDLEVVGLIDDFDYVTNRTFDIEDVIRWNNYGYNVNHLITSTDGHQKELVVNTNIYMLEEEYKSYVSVVNIGLSGQTFNAVHIFVEEEDLDLRENVFDNFLLFKPLFTGRDNITLEREEYYDDMFGYKVSIIGGCILIGTLGLVSLFNGIKSNVDKYKRDIGIYKTLGYTSRNIRRMFFIEGSIISGVIVLSIVVLWGILNLVLNESIVLALDPNRLVESTQIIHFSLLSIIVIFILVEGVVLYSINRQLREVSIIELIRNK